ncbi:hypothetical protein HOY80DRAFT_406247 [Tuber brumale]|nr:hypothetical protein HOY80DRAFT_406247 [Tuber brumale]
MAPLCYRYRRSGSLKFIVGVLWLGPRTSYPSMPPCFILLHHSRTARSFGQNRAMSSYPRIWCPGIRHFPAPVGPQYAGTGLILSGYRHRKIPQGSTHLHWKFTANVNATPTEDTRKIPIYIRFLNFLLVVSDMRE